MVFMALLYLLLDYANDAYVRRLKRNELAERDRIRSFVDISTKRK